jgi:hypothetical protein
MQTTSTVEEQRSRFGLGWKAVFGVYVLGWLACLAASALTARALYADGAWIVLIHLLNPHHFNDIDSQRSFASFITQTPILFGQRIGVASVAAYAALYSIGILVLPASLFLLSLLLARRQPFVFSALGFGAIVFGFGANFINTEANILFGLVCLSATILLLKGPRPLLRGLGLPILAFTLLRVYEGMLLVGPALALWSFLTLRKSDRANEQSGLTIATLLYLLGAVVGAGGLLAPRDPANAANFLSSSFAYFRNPQIFLLISAAAVVPAVASTRKARYHAALVVVAVASAICFLWSVARLDGYLAYSIYYANRSFLVLLLPVYVCGLFLVWLLSPRLTDERTGVLGFAAMLIPFVAAVSADMLGTYRWRQYVVGFCEVLKSNVSPEIGLRQLREAGFKTGWAWTHPTLSVLLRDGQSEAMVANDPSAGWQPFDPHKPVALQYRGLCEDPLVGSLPARTFEVPISFSNGRYPSYVANIRGVSKPEGWATWTDGNEVKIDFSRKLPPSFDLIVKVASVFGDNKGKSIVVRAGTEERSFPVDSGPGEGKVSFGDVGNSTSIRILIPKPESPLEVGLSSDPRRLGIALVSIQLVPK